jgi:NADPH:quinone reductase-like Zn-dependent oxidoreductase
LRADEVLISVRACGVGHWDEVTRTGAWEIGVPPPMALGVEASGVVLAVGDGVDAAMVGARVATHSVPVREQGAWAEQQIAPARDVAVLPAGVPFDVAAAFPVPGLTADQVLTDALVLQRDQILLVHGAGGVTGRLLVQLGAHQGARVIATAGVASRTEISALGADAVLDHADPRWPDEVRALTGGRGVDVAVNAVPGGTGVALAAVRDEGELATITSDSPDQERGVSVTTVYVASDGARLQRLVDLLGRGELTVLIDSSYPLERAAQALERVERGTHGRAVVITPA